MVGVDRRWRVSVDASACLGSGSCAAIAPRHFRLAGDTASPIDVLIEPEDSVLAAVDLCPAEAITVIDSATGESLT